MTTALCGVEYKLVPGETCILPFEPAHPVHRSARNYYWADAPVAVGSVPSTKQGKEETLNGFAQRAKEADHAPEPCPPMRAPVGNRHPDTSREAAERVSRILNNKQFPGIAWVLSVVGKWGMVEQDVSFVYNRYLQPAKELHNEMGSRLQSLRGHGTSPVPGDPWVEYVRDREPCGSNEKMSGIREAPGQKGLARINVNGNPALVQRLTSCPVGWEAAHKFELTLVAKHHETAVAEMKCEIRLFAGLQNP